MFSFFESLALMLMPQQMALKQTALSTSDYYRILNLQVQTSKDLSFFRSIVFSVLLVDKLSVSFPVQSR